MFQVLVLRKSKRRSLLELKDKAWLWTAYRRVKWDWPSCNKFMLYSHVNGWQAQISTECMLRFYECEKIFLVLDNGSLCFQVTARLKGNFHWKTSVKNGKLLSCTIMHVICWQCMFIFFKEQCEAKDFYGKWRWWTCVPR